MKLVVPYVRIGMILFPRMTMEAVPFFMYPCRKTVSAMVFSGEFLSWAIIFFVLALISAAIGARGVAGISMSIARIFVFIFLILALVSIIL